MIQLHIDEGTIDPFGGGGEAHGSFDAVIGTHAAVDAAESHLAYLDGAFSTGSGSTDIGFGGSEYLDVVANDAECFAETMTIVGHGKE